MIPFDWSWPEVDQLEAREKYKAASHFMYLDWIQEPKNLKVFLRLSFTCWYVISEYEVITTTDVESADILWFEILLDELVAFGCKEFRNEPDFLWIFGLLIKLFPENFHETIDEKTGEGLIKKALEIRPDDPIIKLIHCESPKSPEETRAYNGLCQTVRSLLPERFNGEGELQRYFREVLNRV